MTLAQVFKTPFALRMKHRAWQQAHWAYVVQYQRSYMAKYRKTPTGRAIVAKAQAAYYRRNVLAFKLYAGFYQLMNKEK